MKVITPDDEEIVLGDTESTPTIGITDFSRRVTDDFGVTTVVPRAFARRMSVKISLPSTEASTVQRQLAALRAVPAQWIADEDSAWLNFEGFYKDFSIDVTVGARSFCTLTVEGLAETETVPDAGEDPAPAGSASTLQLLQPVTIAGAALVSTNVPETDWPTWAIGTTYALGARVIKTATHRIYESVVAGNVGNDPAGDSGKWIDIGPVNRWAMFDEALGTVTSRVGSIVVTLDAGAATGLALLDVTGATVQVETTGYDETKSVGDGPVTFLDLPGVDADVTVTISGPGTASVGTLLIGSLVKLGITGDEATAGINDFSKKEIDDFGEATIVERAWAKRMSAKALIATSSIDLVANRIAAVRAKPSLWIADEGTDALTIWGFFKDFSIEVDQTVSTLSLSVEGLSEAMPIVETSEGLSIVEKTIFLRSASAPATPTGGSFDFDTMTTTPPSGWSVGVPAGTDPAYISSAIASKEGASGSADFGSWSPPIIAFINGEDGAPGSPGAAGANGLNNAIVYLYRRGATSPAVPSGTFTYTFATATLSGGTLNGWSQDIPAADGNPLWVMAASASSSSGTDAIPATEFTAPVLKDGAGLNAATVFLYQRAASAPAVPAGTLTYTFATAALAGTLGSWSQTAPAHDGNPLYMITATALGATATDTIATGEWSAARVIATNGAAGTAGAPGAPGANGVTYYTWYAYADNDNGTFNFATGTPGGRAFQGIATGKTTPTESTNPADYVWSPYIGPPNFGLTTFNANAVVAANKLIKVAGGGSWNAGIHSTESYKGGASVTFLVDAGPHSFMVGLNTDPTTDANYTSIDFAIYIAGTTLQVYESGGLSYNAAGAVALGDVFTITYNGKNVYYSKNGVVFYTSLIAVPGDLTLFLDTSFLTNGVYFGKILAFVAVGAAGSDGSPGAPGSPGSPGVSPVNALAVPANKQFTADSDGTIKLGQLPFNIAIDGFKAGATISGTVTINGTPSGCTATAISGGFTIDTVFADAGFVPWRFTASDGQIVDGKVSFSRQRDPASGGQVSVNFSSTSWWGSGSYAASGPSTVLPASSTGKLAIAGYASFYCSGNGEARLTAKLQYRAVGSSTWIDSGFTSGPSIAIKTPDLPGEPGENTPGEVSPGGTLTGLTANGSYEVQMVGSRNASFNAIASATGFITLRQVL